MEQAFYYFVSIILVFTTRSPPPPTGSATAVLPAWNCEPRYAEFEYIPQLGINHPYNSPYASPLHVMHNKMFWRMVHLW